MTVAVRRHDEGFKVRLVFSQPCADCAVAGYYYDAWLCLSRADAGDLTRGAHARQAELKQAWEVGDEARLDQIIQEIEDATDAGTEGR